MRLSVRVGLRLRDGDEGVVPHPLSHTLGGVIVGSPGRGGGCVWVCLGRALRVP